jgi:hypothetical protein
MRQRQAISFSIRWRFAVISENHRPPKGLLFGHLKPA